MASTVASAFLGGRALGNVVFGWLADRFGRKKIILGAGVANLAAGAASIAAPNFQFFVVMRFLQSAFATGKSNTGFVCALEFSGPSWRPFSANMYQLSWSAAYMMLAGIAFLLRFHSWRILLMSLLIPETVYYPLVYFFLPESPRWLYLRKKNEEADKVVHKIAKMNNKELPIDMQIKEEMDASTRTPIDLVRSPRIRVLTLSLAFIWAATVFVYYGLSLNTGQLAGNKYLNFFISGAVEFPAYIMVIVVFSRWGRIWPFGITTILSGVVLLLIALVPEGLSWVAVPLAMVGKFFSSASVSMIWIYSTEVYPTCIRNLGLTVTGVTARLSSPISPYVALLAKTNRVLPFIIYGSLALASGLVVFWLPETKDVPMPQTIHDGEDLIRDNRISLKFWKKTQKNPKHGNVIDDVAIESTTI